MRMNEYRTARRVLMEEVSGGRVRGGPRLGWMDGWPEGGLSPQTVNSKRNQEGVAFSFGVGVKVSLVSRGTTVDAVRQCAKDRKKSRTLVHM